MKRSLSLIAFFSLLLLSLGIQAQDIIYVDGNSTATEDGKSWYTPFKTIKSAIDAAKEGDQIWIAKGDYNTPMNDLGTGRTPYLLNKSLSFYGGFDGESSIDERDLENNETVLRSSYEGDLAYIFHADDLKIQSYFNGFKFTDAALVINSYDSEYEIICDFEECEFFELRDWYIFYITGRILKMTINDCLFFKNESRIYFPSLNEGSFLHLNGCVVDGHFNSGFLEVINAPLKIDNCTFKDVNIVGSTLIDAKNSYSEVRNCTFDGVEASTLFYTASSSNKDNVFENCRVNNCILSSNIMFGGINNSSLHLINCDFQENVINKNGFDIYASSTFIKDCDFVNNDNLGYLFYLYLSEDLSVENSQFKNNGDLFSESVRGNVSFFNSSFVGNETVVAIGNAYEFALHNCIISENKNVLLNLNYANLSMNGTVVSDNVNLGTSSSMIFTLGFVKIVDCVFLRNDCSYDVGSGVSQKGTLVQMKLSKFENCVFEENICKNLLLSSIPVYSPHDVNFLNCNINGNQCDNELFGANCKMKLNNCLVVENQCEELFNQSIDLHNSIVWDNEVNTSLDYFNTTSLNSNFQFAIEGEGNMSVDPQFVDPENGDYHLSCTSPLINKGNNEYVTSTVDLDGNERIFAGTVDMGPYETKFDPLATGIPSPDFQLNVTTPCRTAEVTFQNETPNADLYSYHWNFGTGDVSYEVSPHYAFEDAGDFDITLTVINACGEKAEITKTITVSPGFVPQIFNNKTICSGDIVTYTSDASACSSIEWIAENGTILNGQGTSSVEVQWGDAADGNGTLTLNATDCSGAECESPVTVDVAIVPTSVAIKGNLKVCMNRTETYTANIPDYAPATIYSWSVTGGEIVGETEGYDLKTVEVIWENIEGTGEITVQISNELLECTAENTATVNIRNSFQITGKENTCVLNEDVYYPKTGFVWTVEGNNSFDETTNTVMWGNLAGDYAIKAVPVVSDDYCNESDELVVHVTDVPVVNSIGGEVEIMPSESYTYVPDVTGEEISYVWTTEGASNVNKSDNQITIEWDDSGVYSLTAVANSYNACSSDPFVITPVLDKTFSISGDDNICIASGAVFSTELDADVVEYKWFINNQEQSETGNEVSLVFFTPGMNELKMQASRNGKTYTATKMVDVGFSTEKISVTGPTLISPNGNAYTYTVNTDVFETTIKGGTIDSETGNEISVIWNEADEYELMVIAPASDNVCKSVPAFIWPEKAPEISEEIVSDVDNVCPNTESLYSIETDEYTSNIVWTLTSGGVIIGQSKNIDNIEVQWGDVSGDYELSVSYERFGNQTFTKTVTVYDAPQPEIADAIICGDDVTTLQTTTEFPSYEWAIEPSGDIISDQAQPEINTEGLYTVRIIDANSCVGVGEKYVAGVVKPDAGIYSSQDKMISIGSDVGEITLSTYESNPYSYTWYKDGELIADATTAQYSFTMSTAEVHKESYSVTVLSNGCENNADITFEVSSGSSGPGEPCEDTKVSFEVSECEPFSVTNTTPENDGFTWAYGSSKLYTKDIPAITFNEAGKYRLLLSRNNCKATKYLEVPAVAKFSLESPACTNNAMKFVDYSVNRFGQPITKWQWDFGDGSPVESGSEIYAIRDAEHIYSSAGTYTVSLTVYATNSNGTECSNTFTKDIIITDSPVARFDVAENDCTDDLFTFINTSVIETNSAALLWNLDGKEVSAESPSIRFVTTGDKNISLQVTDLLGCVATEVKTVTVVEPVEKEPISINGKAIICNGNAVELHAPSGNVGEYIWYKDGVAQTETDASLSVSVPGEYSVTYVKGTCSVTTDVISVTEFSVPASLTAQSNACLGDDVMFTVEGVDEKKYSVKWTFDGTELPQQGTVLQLYDVVGTNAGAYVATIVDIETGCEFILPEHTLTIFDQPEAPLISLTTTKICYGGEISPVYENPLAGATYDWQINGVSTGNSDELPILTNLTNADSELILMVTDATSGCTIESNVIEVEVAKQIVFNLGNDVEQCNGTSLQIESGLVSGDLTFEWFHNAILIENESVANLNISSLSLEDEGEYYVKTTVKNTGEYLFGCENTSEPIYLSVKNGPLKPEIVGTTKFCEGESVVLKSSVADNLEWNTGETTAEINVNIGGTYIATLTNKITGCSAKSVHTVTMNPLPDFQFLPTGDYEKCSNEYLDFQGLSGFENYQWQLEGQPVAGMNEKIMIKSEGSYTVWAETEAGCEAESDVLELVPLNCYDKCVVLYTDDTGPNTLREAILCANSTAGVNQITFELGDAGEYVFDIQTPLPEITEGVVIDGKAKENTNEYDIIFTSTAGVANAFVTADGITNSEFHNLQFDGFENAINFGKNNSESYVTNSIIKNGTGPAIKYGYGSHEMHVTGNTFQYLSAGVEFDGMCYWNTITSNTFEELDYGVVAFTDAHTTDFINNTFKNIANDGVFYNSTYTNEFISNTFDNIGGHAVHMNGGAKLNGNTISNAGGYGAKVSGFSEIHNNTFTNNASGGVYVNDQQVDIYENVFTNTDVTVKAIDLHGVANNDVQPAVFTGYEKTATGILLKGTAPVDHCMIHIYVNDGNDQQALKYVGKVWCMLDLDWEFEIPEGESFNPETLNYYVNTATKDQNTSELSAPYETACFNCPCFVTSTDAIGSGTLYEAIDRANNGECLIIEFDIDDPAPIVLEHSLPEITVPLKIYGDPLVPVQDDGGVVFRVGSDNVMIKDIAIDQASVGVLANGSGVSLESIAIQQVEVGTLLYGDDAELENITIQGAESGVIVNGNGTFLKNIAVEQSYEGVLANGSWGLFDKLDINNVDRPLSIGGDNNKVIGSIFDYAVATVISISGNDNVIGAKDAPNTIINGIYKGVKVDGGQNNTIVYNAIYDNPLAIELINANNNIQKPTNLIGNQEALIGTISGTAKKGDLIQVFTSTYSSQQAFEFVTELKIDADNFTITVPSEYLSETENRYFRLTATDGVGNTSELSDFVKLTVLPQCLVINTNDSGEGSLRAAVACAGQASGIGNVVFAIPGEGPHIINLTSAIPLTSNSIYIDGTTQRIYVPDAENSEIIISTESLAFTASQKNEYLFKSLTFSNKSSYCFSFDYTYNVVLQDCFFGISKSNKPLGMQKAVQLGRCNDFLFEGCRFGYIDGNALEFNAKAEGYSVLNCSFGIDGNNDDAPIKGMAIFSMAETEIGNNTFGNCNADGNEEGVVVFSGNNQNDSIYIYNNVIGVDELGVNGNAIFIDVPEPAYVEIYENYIGNVKNDGIVVKRGVSRIFDNYLGVDLENNLMPITGNAITIQNISLNDNLQIYNNTIANAENGVFIANQNSDLSQNIIYNVANKAIHLEPLANKEKLPAEFETFLVTEQGLVLAGTSHPNDTVEIFYNSDSKIGQQALQFVGQTIANEGGSWSIIIPEGGFYNKAQKNIYVNTATFEGSTSELSDLYTVPCAECSCTVTSSASIGIGTLNNVLVKAHEGECLIIDFDITDPILIADPLPEIDVPLTINGDENVSIISELPAATAFTVNASSTTINNIAFSDWATAVEVNANTVTLDALTVENASTAIVLNGLKNKVTATTITGSETAIYISGNDNIIGTEEKPNTIIDGTTGVAVDAGIKNTIVYNVISGNDIAIEHQNSGNIDIAAPTDLDGEQTGLVGTITGTAQVGDIIHVYTNDGNPEQALSFVVEHTVTEENFTITIPEALLKENDNTYFVVTLTDADGNTSELSEPVRLGDLPVDCIVTTTAEAGEGSLRSAIGCVNKAGAEGLRANVLFDLPEEANIIKLETEITDITNSYGVVIDAETTDVTVQGISELAHAFAWDVADVEISGMKFSNFTIAIDASADNTQIHKNEFSDCQTSVNIIGDGQSNVSENIFDGNTSSAIMIDGNSVEMSLNIFKNTPDGEKAISLNEGSNGDIKPAEFTGYEKTETGLILSGTAPAGTTVELFYNSASEISQQALQFVGKAIAGEGGSWSYTVSLGAFFSTEHKNIYVNTATLAGNTSELSDLYVTPCYECVCVVESADDTGDKTFRQALQMANDGECMTIDFAIEVPQDVLVSSGALPEIVVPVTINGQEDVTVINSAELSDIGLKLSSDNITLNNLDLSDWNVAVSVNGNNSTIEHCRLSGENASIFVSGNENELYSNKFIGGHVGVLLITGSNNIVGSQTGANLIANGNGTGVGVTTGTNNSILYNRIYGNQLGIVHQNAGNNDYEKPTDLVGEQVEMVGTISGTAHEGDLIQIFSSTNKGEEAFTFVTEFIADADAWTVTVPEEYLSENKNSYFVLTATDANGNTSEFSDRVKVGDFPAFCEVTSNASEGEGTLRSAIGCVNDAGIEGIRADVIFNLPKGDEIITLNDILPEIVNEYGVFFNEADAAVKVYTEDNLDYAFYWKSPDISLKNIEIEGFAVGVNTQGDNAVISNIHFSSNTQSVQINGGNKTQISENIFVDGINHITVKAGNGTISENDFNELGADATASIIIDGSATYEIDANNIFISGPLGISINENATVHVSNNEFGDITGNAILVKENAKYVTISNNTIQSITGTAVVVEKNEKVTISNNIINTSEYAINAYGKVTISENEIFDNTKGGIYVQGNEVTISQNTFNNNEGAKAIDLHDEANGNKQPAEFVSYSRIETGLLIYGNSVAGDKVEIFLNQEGKNQQALKYIGSAVANTSGYWQIMIAEGDNFNPLAKNYYINTATAELNTSELSSPFMVGCLDCTCLVESNLNEGEKTLRDALQKAHQGECLIIEFSAEMSPIIDLTTELEGITVPVTINGLVSEGNPIITLNGQGNGTALMVEGNGVAINNLIFQNWNIAANIEGDKSTINNAVIDDATYPVTISGNENSVINTAIGTNSDLVGVALSITGNNNTIGGTGKGNSIVNAETAGILIDAGTGNQLLNNEIYDSDVAIQHVENGNNLYPSPSKLYGEFVKNGEEITGGVITGNANAGDRIQVFLSTYQGKDAFTYVSQNITADSKFEVTVPLKFLNPEENVFFVLTATDANGNTSELSKPVKIGEVPMNCYVLNTNNEGENSLRDAVDCANIAGSSNELSAKIVFDLPEGANVIALLEPALEIYNPKGVLIDPESADVTVTSAEEKLPYAFYWDVNNVTVKNMKIEGFASGLKGRKYNAKVENIHFSDNDTAVNFFGGGYGRVDENVIENSSVGVYSEGGIVVVNKNKIGVDSEITETAILLDNMVDAYVRNNTIRNVTTTDPDDEKQAKALYANSLKRLECTNNDIENQENATAILLKDIKVGVLKSNTIKNGEKAIQAEHIVNTIIKNNTIDNISTYGIDLINSNFTAINNNTITTIAEGGKPIELHYEAEEESNHGHKPPKILYLDAFEGKFLFYGESSPFSKVEIFYSDESGRDLTELKHTVYADEEGRFKFVEVVDTATVNTLVFRAVSTAKLKPAYSSEASEPFIPNIKVCVVTNTDNAGEGSLRFNIEKANNDECNLMMFDIPGEGERVILPSDDLPIITAQELIIDASSQQGYQSPVPIVTVEDAGEFVNSLIVDSEGKVNINGLRFRGYEKPLKINNVEYSSNTSLYAEAFRKEIVDFQSDKHQEILFIEGAFKADVPVAQHIDAQKVIFDSCVFNAGTDTALIVTADSVVLLENKIGFDEMHDGLAIAVRNTKDSTCIFNNEINNYSNGILIEHAKGAYVRKNIINYPPVPEEDDFVLLPIKNGVRVNESDNVRLFGNKIHYVDSAIIINNSFHINCAGSTVETAGLSGIAVYRSDNTILESNRIVSSPVGIELHELEGATVSQNTIWLHKTAGIVINETATGIEVVKNRIGATYSSSKDLSEGTGIIVKSSNNVIGGSLNDYNEVFNNIKGGVIVDNGVANRITFNRLFNNDRLVVEPDYFAIMHKNGGNNLKEKPQIDNYVTETKNQIFTVTGQAEPFDSIHIYRSDGYYHNARYYIANTVADDFGAWSLTIDTSKFDFDTLMPQLDNQTFSIVATATDPEFNTSELSNMIYLGSCYVGNNKDNGNNEFPYPNSLRQAMQCANRAQERAEIKVAIDEYGEIEIPIKTEMIEFSNKYGLDFFGKNMFGQEKPLTTLDASSEEEIINIFWKIADNVDAIYVDNFNMTGFDTAMYVAAPSNVNLEKMKFDNIKSSAIDIVSSAVDYSLDSLEFTASPEAAYVTFDGGGENISITNSTFTNGKKGLEVNGARAVDVLGNTFEACTQQCNIINGESIFVTGNEFTASNSKHSLYWNNTLGFIKENTFNSQDVSTQMIIDSSGDVKIEENYFLNKCDTCIYVNYSNQAFIKNNTINHAASAAILFNESDGFDIDSNTIKHIDTYGIELQKSLNGEMKDNIIIGFTDHENAKAIKLHLVDEELKSNNGKPDPVIDGYEINRDPEAGCDTDAGRYGLYLSGIAQPHDSIQLYFTDSLYTSLKKHVLDTVAGEDGRFLIKVPKEVYLKDTTKWYHFTVTATTGSNTSQVAQGFHFANPKQRIVVKYERNEGPSTLRAAIEELNCSDLFTEVVFEMIDPAPYLIEITDELPEINSFLGFSMNGRSQYDYMVRTTPDDEITPESQHISVTGKEVPDQDKPLFNIASDCAPSSIDSLWIVNTGNGIKINNDTMRISYLSFINNDGDGKTAIDIPTIDNLVNECTVSGYENGVYLSGAASNNTIEASTIYDTDYGVVIQESASNNDVKENHFSTNITGVWLNGVSGSNYVQDNTFGSEEKPLKNNAVYLKNANTQFVSTNYMNHGELSGAEPSAYIKVTDGSSGNFIIHNRIGLDENNEHTGSSDLMGIWFTSGATTDQMLNNTVNVNQIVGVTNSALVIENCASGFVSRNYFGIDSLFTLAETDEDEYDYSKVPGVGKNAVLVKNSSTMTISGNTAVNFGEYAVDVQSSDEVMIESNVMFSQNSTNKAINLNGNTALASNKLSGAPIVAPLIYEDEMNDDNEIVLSGTTVYGEAEITIYEAFVYNDLSLDHSQKFVQKVYADAQGNWTATLPGDNFSFSKSNGYVVQVNHNKRSSEFGPVYVIKSLLCKLAISESGDKNATVVKDVLELFESTYTPCPYSDFKLDATIEDMEYEWTGKGGYFEVITEQVATIDTSDVVIFKMSDGECEYIEEFTVAYKPAPVYPDFIIASDNYVDETITVLDIAETQSEKFTWFVIDAPFEGGAPEEGFSSATILDESEVSDYVGLDGEVHEKARKLEFTVPFDGDFIVVQRTELDGCFIEFEKQISTTYKDPDEEEPYALKTEINSLEIFPSPVPEGEPVKAYINTTSEDPITITIYNMDGSAMWSTIFEGDTEYFEELDINTFITGMYVIEMKTKTETVVSKFMVGFGAAE